jgi:hypothetical protein
MQGSSDDVVAVPPRPQVLVKMKKLKLKKVAEYQENDHNPPKEGKVRFEVDKERRTDDLESSDDDSGSQIMFTQMSKGACSMLSSSNSISPCISLSPSASFSSLGEALPLDTLPEAEGEGVDLQPLKKHMGDLTLRLSKRANAGNNVPARKKVGGGGTIRLYHAMNKGYQRLGLDQKNENEKERDGDSEDEGDKATEKEERKDAWAEKRKQLGEARKPDPVFVWKTLTLRPPPNAISAAPPSSQGSGYVTAYPFLSFLISFFCKERAIRRYGRGGKRCCGGSSSTPKPATYRASTPSSRSFLIR